jgi:diguanylate cyclase (GGDEF)-like protein
VEDVIARIGGDEFAVLLPDTSAQEMAAALPRLQSAIDELNTGCDGPVLQLSYGTSTAEQGESLIEALKKADANMYIQKQKRNGDSR